MLKYDLIRIIIFVIFLIKSIKFNQIIQKTISKFQVISILIIINIYKKISISL